jgi:hypothetical protein
MDNEKRFVSIDEMQEKISEFGAKAIWQNIERLGNWQERTAYRQLFFIAGGSLDE